MAEDRYLVLPDALAHRVDQFIEVGKQLVIFESNDLPAPRWSQLTTVKVFSSGELNRRKKLISLIPGPPWRRIKDGLARLSPRIITH